jgi:putative SOS response-associated peptidase YedK
LVRDGESNTRAERLAVRLCGLTIQAPPQNLPPRYNICPTDPVDVVTESDGNRDLVRMRWGLVPSCWPKPLKELKAATFNARTETVAERLEPYMRARPSGMLRRGAIAANIGSSRTF